MRSASLSSINAVIVRPHQPNPRIAALSTSFLPAALTDTARTLAARSTCRPVPEQPGLTPAAQPYTRYRAGISSPLQDVSTSVTVISSSAIAEAKGQLLLALNSQYSSGAIIWNRGPPSRYGVA